MIIISTIRGYFIAHEIRNATKQYEVLEGRKREIGRSTDRIVINWLLEKIRREMNWLLEKRRRESEGKQKIKVAETDPDTVW